MMYRTSLMIGVAALALGGCTRDPHGHYQFDPVKACRALVLAQPTIDLAKRAALDAGAKPGDVERTAAVASDLAAFANAICPAITS